MSLNVLADHIAFANDKKGFAFGPDKIHQQLLLVVSEVCEAQDALRDGRDINEIYYEDQHPLMKPCGFPVEIADAIIRLLHICGNFGIDIDAVVHEKLDYNAQRPMKHGRQF